MDVVHLAGNPVAGAPYAISRAMNMLSGVSSRAIQGLLSLRDGKKYDGDLSYDSPLAADLVRDADVVFIHNSVKDKRLKDLIKDKYKIMVCHSQPSDMEREMFVTADAHMVVAQYQPRLYEGHCDFTLAPNIIHIDDGIMLPEAFRTGLTVGYTPSNTKEWGDTGIRAWNRKGYKDTMDALGRSGINYYHTTGRPLSEVLAERKTCAVIIDEIITGSYHRTSLEGASHGQMVLNAIDKHCEGIIKEVSGANTHPFHVTTLETIHETLKFIKESEGLVYHYGREAREWMEKYWRPKELAARFYLSVAERA